MEVTQFFMLTGFDLINTCMIFVKLRSQKYYAPYMTIL